MVSLDPFISTVDLSNAVPYDVTNDPMATIAINAACNIVRRAAGQVFNGGTDTIGLDGTGTDCLLLPEAPVTAAGTVLVEGGTLIQGQDYVVADDCRLLRTSGTAWSSSAGLGDVAIWPRGRQNVQVTYDHGGTAVPDEVRAVALQVAARMVVQGIANSETVAGQSVTYSSPALDLTKGEQLILTRCRPY